MKINGTTIKTPSSLKVTISDIDGESYRNAKGNTVRDRLAIKRKLECTWKALTQSEMSTLLTAVQDTFFTVTYQDPKLGNTTKTFYVGDRNAPVYSYNDKFHTWESLSMNFVEK